MPQRPANQNAFVGGLVLGLFAGGIVLAFILFVLFGTTIGSTHIEFAFAAEYLVAILLGVAAMMAVRRYAGFGSGLLVGVAAGLLGGSALCNAVMSGLNNMH